MQCRYELKSIVTNSALDIPNDAVTRTPKCRRESTLVRWFLLCFEDFVEHEWRRGIGAVAQLRASNCCIAVW